MNLAQYEQIMKYFSWLNTFLNVFMPGKSPKILKILKILKIHEYFNLFIKYSKVPVV